MSAQPAQRVPWLAYLGLGAAAPPATNPEAEPEPLGPAPAATPPPAAEEATAALRAAEEAAAALRAARAEWTDRLWGPGFLLPGGLAEANRLSTLLPLSPATTVLQLGSDAGGLAGSLAQGRGAWVAAQQDDPLLLERATQHLKSLGKRVTLSPWDPAAPAFRAGYHHHALLVEALQRATPERLLPALSAALREAGQLVMLELVLLAEPTGSDAAYLAHWQEIERRATPPTEAAISSALAQAGFVVHVVEDCGHRHSLAALEAWGRVLAELRASGRPGRLAGRALLAEIEPWLLRQRLINAGCLGLRRWHASRGR